MYVWYVLSLCHFICMIQTGIHKKVSVDAAKSLLEGWMHDR